ncbi:MAG: hypothetical protein ACYCPM_03145, partial [Acidobacteriaceae bacterium]
MKRASAACHDRKILWTVSILILATGMAAAQHPSYYTKWINYTVANGFPPGEVYCITVDGNHVWAGTGHGLVLLEDGRVQKV